MEQFNVDKWLQDKSRKVVTRDRREVRIVFTEAKNDNYPILALVQQKTETKKEQPHLFSTHGVYEVGRESCIDLFFADNDELTEFEKELNRIVISFSDAHAYMDETEIHHYSKGLLDLARKELQPEFDKEMDKLLAETDKVVYQKGKQDALKSLPKWKKAHEHKEFPLHVCVMDENMYPFLDTEVNEDEYYIELENLKTLPK